jgi:tetratricopeptide (TPR) repeat protein
MMRTQLSTGLLALMATMAYAADLPSLDTTISHCENHWFVGEDRDPSARALGFAYVDSQAGFTAEMRGEVVLGRKDEWVRRTNALEGTARLIMRIPSNMPVRCLTAEEVTTLGLPIEPEGQDAYQDTRESGAHWASWASHYNHIGAVEQGLEFARRARKGGNVSRLAFFEEGFSLNALEKYDEAVVVLATGVKNFPKDAEMVGELAYSHLAKGHFQEAISLYQQAIDVIKPGSRTRRAEFAQNVAVAYKNLGNQESAATWFKRAREWHDADSK